MSTFSSYTGDGATTQFDITFSYADAASVFVEVDGVDTEFSFINPSRVELASAPAQGTEVRLFRRTDVSTPAVDFNDGAIVLADDLDLAVGQSRLRTEEISSETIDLNNRALKAPPGEAGFNIPSESERSLKYLAFDADGKSVATPGTSDDPKIRDDLDDPSKGASLVRYSRPGLTASARTLDEKLADSVSVKDFGALGDGSGFTVTQWVASGLYTDLADLQTDYPHVTSLDDTIDWAASQAAINYAYDQGTPFPTVFFPSGKYLINRGLDRSGTGNYTDLIGEGKRNTMIVASEAMDTMLLLANDTDIVGRSLVEGFTFDGASLANRAIDAEIMRYWTLSRVELLNTLVEGAVVGNWVTTLTDDFTVRNCPIGLRINGRDTNPSAANGLNIELGEVSECPIGIQVDDRSNNIYISNMRIDLSEDAGIYIKSGGRHIDIRETYFERAGRGLSGDGVGVPVTNLNGSTTNVAAAIVATHQDGSLSSTGFSGTVEDNFFANCNTSRYIALTNVTDFQSSGNKVHDGYSTDAFVEILSYGCGSNCRRFDIEESFDPTIVGQIVALNGESGPGSHQNMRISNLSQSGTDARATGQVWNDLLASYGGTSLWIGPGSVTQSVVDGHPVHLFTNASRNRLIVPLDAGHPLLGRYLRLHGQAKDVASSAGIYVEIRVTAPSLADPSRLLIDGLGGFSSWAEFGSGQTVYIPEDATQLELYLSTVDSNDIYMRNFALCDASLPLDAVPTL